MRAHPPASSPSTLLMEQCYDGTQEETQPSQDMPIIVETYPAPSEDEQVSVCQSWLKVIIDGRAVVLIQNHSSAFMIVCIHWMLEMHAISKTNFCTSVRDLVWGRQSYALSPIWCPASVYGRLEEPRFWALPKGCTFTTPFQPFEHSGRGPPLFSDPADQRFCFHTSTPQCQPLTCLLSPHAVPLCHSGHDVCFCWCALLPLQPYTVWSSKTSEQFPTGAWSKRSAFSPWQIMTHGKETVGRAYN